MAVYRILLRHGLAVPAQRRRCRKDYVRWEQARPMELWQMDIVGGIFLADGTEAKVVTGVDDHSRFCLIAAVAPRATGRAVCLAFAQALLEFGVPDEVLTDNGKQFTARFGNGGEVMFDRICRENRIVHRLTPPATPTPPAPLLVTPPVTSWSGDAVEFDRVVPPCEAVSLLTVDWPTWRACVVRPGRRLQIRALTVAGEGRPVSPAGRRRPPTMCG